MPKLKAVRLDLREIVEEDLDTIGEILADPEVERWFARRFTREESAAWIARQQERYARDGYGYWLVLERATGQAVGLTGPLLLEVDGGAKEPGLGWITHAPSRGRGFAVESATACRDWLFETQNCERVITLIRPDNELSLRVAAKLGMTPQGTTLFHGLEHILLAVSRDAARGHGL